VKLELRIPPLSISEQAGQKALEAALKQRELSTPTLRRCLIAPLQKCERGPAGSASHAAMSVTDRILSALTTVIRMNDNVEEMAGLMKGQQRRIDNLNGRMIRLETVLELALNRPSPHSFHLPEAGLGGNTTT